MSESKLQSCELNKQDLSCKLKYFNFCLNSTIDKGKCNKIQFLYSVFNSIKDHGLSPVMNPTKLFICGRIL